MFKFKKIRTKLLVGFGAVIVLVVTMSVLNFLGLRTINDQTEGMVELQMPLLTVNKDLSNNISEVRSLIRAYMLFDKADYKDQLEEKFEEGKKLESQLLSMIDASYVDALFAEKAEWEKQIRQAADENEQGNKEKALETLQQTRTASVEMLAALDKLEIDTEEYIQESGEELLFVGFWTNMFISIIALVIIIVSVIIALLVSRSITRPISAVMNRMDAIAEGDLSQEALVLNTKDETARLVASTNTMSHNTRELLNSISEVSDSVSSQSEELTQAANEVRSGTEQVASTMEELASGAEMQANSASDLTTVIGMFSSKVDRANQNGEQIQRNSGKVLEMTAEGSKLMNSSTEQMEKISAIVNDSVEKMNGLNSQSQEISKLVSVINDIAAQTNLLALNAAIEAARAGEHGSGFAVVADEVRTLAEQVALSVNDITNIVTNIQTESSVVSDSLQIGYTEVEHGTNQIVATEKTFNEISTQVAEMAENITEVSANLQEITDGSVQMTQSIEEVASVSEEAAAGVEQTAASAEQSSSSMEEVAGSSSHLATLAGELNELVGRFKL